MKDFNVRGEYITLGQFLKAIGIIAAGGDVRGYLDEFTVLVNGEREERRGRKLRPTDSVILPSGDRINLIADW